LNKRGSAHIHGQAHCGLIPSLLADVACDEELLSLALDGLNSQLQAELPLEYHLVDTARKVLRIGARRDVAEDIPIPHKDLISSAPPETSQHNRESWAVERRIRLEEWWSEFSRHALLVVANRNVHQHQGSCLMGKQGKFGCRFNAHWGHDVDKSRCVELFCDDTSVIEAERMEYRCDECHAGGAMTNTTNPKEENDTRIAEANCRRDLFFTAAKPTRKPDVGEDTRILAVDLKRSKLRAPHRANYVHLVKQARAEIRNGETPTPETVAHLREALRKTIDNNDTLANLLSTPALRVLRERIVKLSVVPPQQSDYLEVLSECLSLDLCL